MSLPRASNEQPPIHGLALTLKEASTPLARQQPPPTPIVSIKDCRINSEPLVLGTLAEHTLPFAMAPVLLTYQKNSYKTLKRCKNFSLDMASASYKMRYGLAETFSNETIENIKKYIFFLRY